MLRSLTSLLVCSPTLTCPEFGHSKFRQHLTVAIASVGQHIMLHDGDQVCLLPSQPGEVLTIRTSPGSGSLSVPDSANGSRYLSLHVFALLLLLLCVTPGLLHACTEFWRSLLVQAASTASCNTSKSTGKQRAHEHSCCASWSRQSQTCGSHIGWDAWRWQEHVLSSFAGGVS